MAISHGTNKSYSVTQNFTEKDLTTTVAFRQALVRCGCEMVDKSTLQEMLSPSNRVEVGFRWQDPVFHIPPPKPDHTIFSIEISEGMHDCCTNGFLDPPQTEFLISNIDGTLLEMLFVEERLATVDKLSIVEGRTPIMNDEVLEFVNNYVKYTPRKVGDDTYRRLGYPWTF